MNHTDGLRGLHRRRLHFNMNGVTVFDWVCDYLSRTARDQEALQARLKRKHLPQFGGISTYRAITCVSTYGLT